MTLQEALAALSVNTNINVALIESDGTSLITFNAGGYESIESDLFSRTVDSITVDSGRQVSVKLTAINN